MKIVVVFKWLKNPQDARVGSDGSVDWRGVKMATTDDDPAAMVVAKELASEPDEIIGLTIGDGDTAWAAARGASSTVVIDDVPEQADSSLIGKVLAAAVRQLGDVDVVVIGDSSWDYAVVSALTGYSGCFSVANVVSAAVVDEKLRIARKINGMTQQIDVSAPVILAVTASRAEQQAPGMKEVLAARKKPLTKLSVAELGIQPSLGVITKGTKLPDTEPAKIIDGSDPAAAAKELIAALRLEGVL